jgi:hypothetical protein
MYNKENAKTCPHNLLKIVYDKDDNVLFGSRKIKGRVEYNYVPAELMENGNPYIISSSISYDGKGNINLPQDAKIMSFNELPAMFPDNEFSL